MNRKSRVWFVLTFLVLGSVTFAKGFEPVRNVIVMVMDGTGSTHTTVTRWVKGGPLALDRMAAGLIRTYNAESIITDSAPAATAFACGVKTSDKVIGIFPGSPATPNVPSTPGELQYQPAASVLEGAKLKGKSVGLVATSNIQHATPAGFSAHWPDRGDYNEIAEQQVYENLDVVFGGGRRYLVPKSKGGTREDGEDLIAVLRQRGVCLISTGKELAAVKAGKVWGLFAEDDLAYELDRRVLAKDQPSLAEMTKKAIELLSANPKGFFLFVEGSKIDWASHANDPVGVVSDVLAFDEAVKAVLDFAQSDGQTLVLAFADHGNGGMAIGKSATTATYAQTSRNALVKPFKRAVLTGEGVEKVLGEDRSVENIRKTVGRYLGIDDLTSAEISAIANVTKGHMNYVLGPIFSRRTIIGWTTNGHTGEDVPLYAFGPGHPTGVIENTELALTAAQAMNFDLAATTRRLFVPADRAFKEKNLPWQIDAHDPANPVLVVHRGPTRFELPLSKNILKSGQAVRQLEGLTVLAPRSRRVYIPQQAVDWIEKEK